jgi:hypothetical protein
MSMVASFTVLHDDMSEMNPRTSSSLSDDISLLSSLVSDEKSSRASDCLSKQAIENMFDRSRRASISRPYFHHWRGTRENVRPPSRNFLAFSPRLGRKVLDTDHSADTINTVRGEGEPEDAKPMPPAASAEHFLITLLGHLQKNKIDIIYEDSTKICSSQVIGKDIIMDILEKMGVGQPQHD